MNTSGEAAEQVVRMMLEGSEVLIKLTGSGAKNVAVLLYSILRQQKKTRGSARLTSMLRSGKPLKVFTFKREDLAQFKNCAGRYGILYTVLKGRNDRDGYFDVMIRADDESKLARLVERFKLASVNTASLRAEIVKEKDLPPEEKEKEGEDKEEAEKEPGDEKEKEEPEGDVGDAGDEKIEPERKPDKAKNIAELQAVMGKESNENQNPTEAKTEQASTSSFKDEGTAMGQSRVKEPEQSEPNPPQESTGKSQSPDESPFWPSSTKKKEEKQRISVRIEIEKKRAAREAAAKAEKAKEKGIAPEIKNTNKDKEGR